MSSFIGIVEESFKNCVNYDPYSGETKTTPFDKNTDIKSFFYGCWHYFSFVDKDENIDDCYKSCFKNLKDFIIKEVHSERMEYTRSNSTLNIETTIKRIYNSFSIRDSFKFGNIDVIPEKDRKLNYENDYTSEVLFAKKVDGKIEWKKYEEFQEDNSKLLYVFSNNENKKGSKSDINIKYFVRYKLEDTGNVLVDYNNEYYTGLGNIYWLLDSFEKCLKESNRKEQANAFFKDYFYKGLLDRYRTIKIDEKVVSTIKHGNVYLNELRPIIYSYLDGLSGTFERVNTVDFKQLNGTNEYNPWMLPIDKCDFKDGILKVFVFKSDLPASFNTIKNFKTIEDYLAKCCNFGAMVLNERTDEIKAQVIKSLCYPVNLFLNISTKKGEKDEGLFNSNKSVTDITFNNSHAIFEFKDIKVSPSFKANGYMYIQNPSMCLVDNIPGNYVSEAEILDGYYTDDFSSCMDDREFVAIQKEEDPANTPIFRVSYMTYDNENNLFSFDASTLFEYYCVDDIKYVKFLDCKTNNRYFGRVKNIDSDYKILSSDILEINAKDKSSIINYDEITVDDFSTVENDTIILNKTDKIKINTVDSSIEYNDDNGPKWPEDTIINNKTLYAGDDISPQVEDKTLKIQDNISIIQSDKVIKNKTIKIDLIWNENHDISIDEYKKYFEDTEQPERKINIEDIYQAQGTVIAQIKKGE